MSNRGSGEQFPVRPQDGPGEQLPADDTGRPVDDGETTDGGWRADAGYENAGLSILDPEEDPEADEEFDDEADDEDRADEHADENAGATQQFQLSRPPVPGDWLPSARGVGAGAGSGAATGQIPGVRMARLGSAAVPPRSAEYPVPSAAGPDESAYPVPRAAGPVPTFEPTVAQAPRAPWEPAQPPEEARAKSMIEALRLHEVDIAVLTGVVREMVSNRRLEPLATHLRRTVAAVSSAERQRAEQAQLTELQRAAGRAAHHYMAMVGTNKFAEQPVGQIANHVVIVDVGPLVRYQADDKRKAYEWWPDEARFRDDADGRRDAWWEAAQRIDAFMSAVSVMAKAAAASRSATVPRQPGRHGSR